MAEFRLEFSESRVSIGCASERTLPPDATGRYWAARSG